MAALLICIFYEPYRTRTTSINELLFSAKETGDLARVLTIFFRLNYYVSTQVISCHLCLKNSFLFPTPLLLAFSRELNHRVISGNTQTFITNHITIRDIVLLLHVSRTQVVLPRKTLFKNPNIIIRKVQKLQQNNAKINYPTLEAFSLHQEKFQNFLNSQDSFSTLVIEVSIVVPTSAEIKIKRVKT